jgi:fibronectin-binding autotransporter adhesin
MTTFSNPLAGQVRLLLPTLLLVGTASSTRAAEYVWDANKTTTGAQDGGDIAGDIWGVAGQQGNWRTTSDNQNWADANTATFGATSGGTYAVTVGGTINTANGNGTAGGLNFKQSGYTLSAASAQVVNLGTTSAYLTLAAGVTATIGDKVSVTKNNAAGSSLFLFGSNNAANVGTLRIGSGTPGGGAVLESLSNSNVNVSRGITLDVRTGGTFASAASSIILGSTGTNESGFTNTLNVSGGTVNVGGNYLVLGNFYNTNATTSTADVTISAGEINLNATAGGLRFGTSNANITTNGTVHLNGGVITAAQVSEAGPNGSHSSTFNFNGGELKVLSGTSYATDFIKNLDTAQIRDGGARINTNGVNTTIGQALVHSGIGGDLAIDGGLEKKGAGTLTLTNTSTYTGATTVRQGALVVNGNISTSSLTTVDSGATLGGSGSVGKTIINGTLAVGNSPGTMTFTNTLELNGSTMMEIDGTSGTGVTGGHDFVKLTGAGPLGILTYGGTLTLDMGTVFANGTYTWDLFDMAGETGTFTSISLADRYSGSLLDVDLNGVWDLTSGNNTWQFTESTGVLGLTVVPESRTALLGLVGTVLLLRRRRL